MKKALSLILIVLFVMAPFEYGFAESEKVDNSVSLLYELNILKGDGSGLSSLISEEPVTKLEASIIILRLLGLENEAMQYGGDNFIDVKDNHWARNLLSYIHDKQIDMWEVKDNKFNPNENITSELFTKRLLSILGNDEYSDSFVDEAKNMGLASVLNKSTINMQEAAKLIEEALNIKIKDSKTTLAEYLVEKKLIDRKSADTLGLVENYDNNILTMAVAWKQTAAEYNALFYQGFNMARLLVDKAIENQKPGDLPLAIVTDLDDTLVVPLSYWGYLIDNDYDFFDDPIWDKWIPENKMVPTAGSLEFLQYCKDKGVEVFYVTSRDQGEKTYEYALGNIKAMGFPYADEEHLTVLMDTSNKEAVQTKIGEKYNIAAYLGDNLNDFRRIYYVKDIEERAKLVAEDKNLYGNKYIIFPNPTDGHWVRAIFGESEPAPSNANRDIWKNSATKTKWQPE